MQLTTQALQATFQGFSALFNRGFQTAPIFWNQIATAVQSDGAELVHHFMAAFPRMKEWVQERYMRNLTVRDFTIKNKDWELTIEVDRNAILDDRLGVFAPQFEMMGRSVRKHPDDLMVTLLQAGHTSLCFDGQYFFDTDHPVSLDNTSYGTQQNYWSSGKALTHANYDSVRAAMMSFKDESNSPMGIMPDLLVVPPALESTGKLILEADYIPSAAGTASQTNVYKGTAKLLVVNELAGQDTTWYLLATGLPVKPFVYQDRMAPQFVSKTSLTDDNLMLKKKFIYGVDSRDNAGYGLWHLAAKAVA